MKTLGAAIIGVGEFSRNVIIPGLRKTGEFDLIAGLARPGDDLAAIERQFSLRYATTDYAEILADKTIDCVFIATRHDAHKRQIVEATRAGKSVFTEKPMAMSVADAKEIVAELNKNPGKLMVGFNRRFSPLTAKLKSVMAEIPPPYMMHYRWINKAWDSDWPFDPIQGGGKLISSGCHMIDLVIFLMGAMPRSVTAYTGALCHAGIKTHDAVSVIMDFGDAGVVNVFSGELGAKTFPQESLEVFTRQGVMEIDNFNGLKFYDIPEEDILFSGPEKGFHEEFLAFAEYLKSESPSPCGARDGLNAALCAQACMESALTSKTIAL